MGVVLALLASSAVAVALAQTSDGARPQVGVLVAGQAAESPAVVARAKAAAAATNADIRIAHTTADQLGVTHLLAARGYETIVTVGVDRRIAITPVAKRYPGTRFVETDSNQLDRALSR